MCCGGVRGCTGKCMLFACSMAFSVGVLTSVLSPSWITISINQSGDKVLTGTKSFAGGTLRGSTSTIEGWNDVSVDMKRRIQVTAGTFEARYGPYYGETRTCDPNSGVCSNWEHHAIDLSDCDAVEQSKGEHKGELCRQMTTWRSLAIICMFIVVFTGMVVIAGFCCQMVTCGCCGASLDFLAMVAYWIEVALSIVAWSFVISTVHMIRALSEHVNAGYEWGFWLFIATGTFLGGVCATFADWASDDSCLRKLFRCGKNLLKKILCCCPREDEY